MLVDIMSPDKLPNTTTPEDSDPGRGGFIDRNLFFRNYPTQLLALQQQRDRLIALRDQGINRDSIFAAAVQRQLMAASSGQAGNLSKYAIGNHNGLGSSIIVPAVGAPSPLIRGSLEHTQQTRGNLPTIGDSLKQISDATLANPSRVLPTTIPCQARGMTSDHNSTTAFFGITSETKHGQHLWCSHAGCRASGVKFRYCEVCKKPVTKQNFRSRHLHADRIKTGEQIDPEVTSDSPSRKRKSMGGDKEESSQEKEYISRGLIPGVGSSANMFLLQKEFPVVGRPETIAGARFMSIETDSSTFPQRLESIRLNNQKMIKLGRKERWASLLSERPRDLQGDIGKWLAMVLEVSDTSRDLPRPKTTEEINPPKDSCQGRPSNQIAAWQQLLEERPNVSVGSEATDWLVKVLKVSCWGSP